MKVEKHIEVTIIMGLLEAHWLKSVMQNPLHGETLDSETETDKTIREMFWKVLKEEGIE